MGTIKIQTKKPFTKIKDMSESSDPEKLWSSLLAFINEKRGAFSSVFIDESRKTVKMSFADDVTMRELLDLEDPSMFLKKNLVRTVRANFEFSREKKGLVLSDKNTSMFPRWNEVEYSVTCSPSSLPKNSIFFHESSLADYMDDGFDKEAYFRCKDLLALASINVKTLAADKDNKIKEEEWNEVIALVYNEENHEFSGEDSPESLKTKSLVSSSEIARIANGSTSETLDRVDELEDGTLVSYKFSGLRVKTTSLKLPRGLESFYAFRAFIGQAGFSRWAESALEGAQEIEL